MASPIWANGTPSWSARSAAWARSSPESCTVAMPAPLPGAGAAPGAAGPRRGGLARPPASGGSAWTALWRQAPGRASADGEQFKGVGQLSEITDPVHAVGPGERLPAAVRGGERAGVGGHHHRASGRVADGEEDDGDVAFGGAWRAPVRSRAGCRIASRTRASTLVSGSPSA